MTGEWEREISDTVFEKIQKRKYTCAAVKSIGCATYYIAACGEKEEDATQFIVNANVKHELLPFVYLPLFQLLSNTVTTDLNRWQKHPMYKHFNDNIRSKMKWLSDRMIYI